MEYALQNEKLSVRANTQGAELVSVRLLPSGEECIWQADPAMWNRQAPLLFPYSGRLYQNELVANGKRHTAPIHGFARDSAFTLHHSDEDTLVFRLESDENTRAVYPYAFLLEVGFSLHGNHLAQRVRVHNPAAPGVGALPFSVGFHPAFALPLQPGSPVNRHSVAFEKPESPRLIETPGGYVSGEERILFREAQTLALRDDVFEEGSLCLAGLRSSHLTLCSADGGRRVQVGIEGYPYTLLWGPPAQPRFVCIEPWHTLPDGPAPYGEFANKPGLVHLKPGGWYETTLHMRFIQPLAQSRA